MPLTNNTTITFTGNESAHGQQNSSYIFADSNSERISKLCACFFILLGSFFGNTSIILIVYKHQDLRKTINYFIVNMAVSDLLFPLILIPVQITQLVTEPLHWHLSGMLGSIFCKLFYFASSVSLFVSAQSLVWIAIDRFLAVVFPIKVGLISSKIRTIAIASTWILAGVFYFPLLLIRELVKSDNNTVCIVVWENFFSNKESYVAYHWLHLTIRSFAPFFLITVLYSAIAITLKRGRKALADTPPKIRGQRYLKKRRQATQMAVVILVLFYICIIPYALLSFVYSLRPSCDFLKSFYLITFFMFFFSSVVNPIICLSFVESYRRGLKNIVCHCCGIRDSKIPKQERITLNQIRNHSDENCERLWATFQRDRQRPRNYDKLSWACTFLKV